MLPSVVEMSRDNCPKSSLVRGLPHVNEPDTMVVSARASAV